MTEAEAARTGGLFLAGGERPLTGALVPVGPWEGRVVGVFSKAVSILHPDGALVSLVDRESRMEARALSHPDGWRAFAAMAARALESAGGGPPAVRRDGRSLELCGPGPAALDFAQAGTWDPAKRYPIMAAIERAQADAAIALVSRGLEAAGSGEAPGRRETGCSPDGAFSREFSRAPARLRSAADFPANLVGFGLGTTPSGDDWLAGYLCGRDLLAGGYGRGERELRAVLPERLGRTTAAGRALLLGAIAGLPPAYLARLTGAASAFGSGAQGAYGSAADGDGLRRAVADALRHGASSGRDALCGFMAGLSG